MYKIQESLGWSHAKFFVFAYYHIINNNAEFTISTLDGKSISINIIQEDKNIIDMIDNIRDNNIKGYDKIISSLEYTSCVFATVLYCLINSKLPKDLENTLGYKEYNKVFMN
jgi:hypothetical protein